MDKIKDIEVTETVTRETVKTIDYRKAELEKAIEEFIRMFGNSEPQPHLFVAFQSMIKELKQIGNFGNTVKKI